MKPLLSYEDLRNKNYNSDKGCSMRIERNRRIQAEFNDEIM